MMGISNHVRALCGYLPDFYLNRNELKETQKLLGYAGIGIRAEKIVPLSILGGLVVSLYCTSIYIAIFGFGLFFPFAVIFFGIGYLSVRFLLARAAWQRDQLFESELSSVGRLAHVALAAGATLEEAIAYLGGAGYYSSAAFRGMANSIANGVPVINALEEFGSGIRSLNVKRFIHQLAIIYETNNREAVGVLLKLAEDMDGISSIRLREFSGKLSFLSLIYIGAACILPAFALVLVLFGNMFLGFEIGENELFLLYAVAFPILDALALQIILGQIPFSISHTVAGMPQELNPIKAYFAGTGRAALEEELPQALFQASALYKSKTLEGLVEKLALIEGLAGLFFRKIRNSMASGVGAERSLQLAAGETDSVFVKRTLGILLIGYRAGSDLTETLRALAAMVMETLALVKERRAVFTVHKYTLFFSLAIIVPVILGSTYNLALSLASLTGAAGMHASALVAVQIYLAIASAITAYFVAAAESQDAKAIVYFFIIYLPAILIFPNGIPF